MNDQMKQMMTFAHIFARHNASRYSSYQEAFKAGLELTWQRRKQAQKEKEWFEANKKAANFGPLN